MNRFFGFGEGRRIEDQRFSVGRYLDKETEYEQLRWKAFQRNALDTIDGLERNNCKVPEGYGWHSSRKGEGDRVPGKK